MARSKPAFARGSRAWGHCARTGDRVLLRDLVRDGRTGLPVTRQARESRHPQERPNPIYDPQALRNPSPNRDHVGYTVTWPTGDFARLWETYDPLVLSFHLASVVPFTDVLNVVSGGNNVVNGADNVIVGPS